MHCCLLAISLLHPFTCCAVVCRVSRKVLRAVHRRLHLVQRYRMLGTCWPERLQFCQLTPLICSLALQTLLCLLISDTAKSCFICAAAVPETASQYIGKRLCCKPHACWWILCPYSIYVWPCASGCFQHVSFSLQLQHLATSPSSRQMCTKHSMICRSYW